MISWTDRFFWRKDCGASHKFKCTFKLGLTGDNEHRSIMDVNVSTIFCFQAFPSISNIVHLVFIAVGMVFMALSVPFTFLTSRGQRGRRVMMVAYLSPGKTTASQVPWRDIMMPTCTRHWLGSTCLMTLLFSRKLGSLSIFFTAKGLPKCWFKKIDAKQPFG